MDEAAIISALRGYWIGAWVAPLDTAYIWEDDADPEEPGTSWLRVTLRSSETERRGVGRRREENRGLVAVEVRVPRPLGPGPADRLASSVAGVWRAFRHPRIQLTAPSVVGLAVDGAFNRRLITLGWRGDMRFAQA